MQKIQFSNPYALPLRDAQRDYQQTFEKRLWTPADIQRLENLNRKVQKLKALVALYDVGRRISDR